MKRIFTLILSLTILLGSIVPGTAFGQITESATVTNSAAPRMTPPLRQICFAIENNLSFGNKDRQTNGSVINLQAFLFARGFLKVEPTGYFGVMTLQAVKDFQRAHDLPPTGWFGPMSRGKMKALTCEGGVVIPGEKTVSYSVKTDKQVYLPHESIKIDITATNNTGAAKTLNFNTGCQTSYMIGGYNSVAAMLCLQALTSRTIPANSAYTWTMTHTPADYQLSVGNHTVKGIVIDAGSAEVSIKIVATEADKFKVTAPNVGEIWKAGDKKEIRWSPQTINETVDIQLLPHTNCTKDPCPLMLIKPYDLALKTSANQVFSWTVGNNLEGRIITASAYDILVCQNGKPRVCDTGDAQIVIEGTVPVASVKVLNPNGGETVKRGSTYSIQWTDGAGQLMVPNAGLRETPAVDIYLRSYLVCITTPCEGQKFTIVKNYSGQNYVWTVGTLIEKILIGEGNYQVEVCLAGTSICDKSDSFFSLTDSAQAIPTITSIQPSGKVGSTVYIYGTNFTNTSAVRIGNGYLPKEAVKLTLNQSGAAVGLNFKLPEGVGICNPHIAQACILMLQMLNPGVYKVSIENTDVGRSNEVNFSVTN